jgi:hypothetical protein
MIASRTERRVSLIELFQKNIIKAEARHQVITFCAKIEKVIGSIIERPTPEILSLKVWVGN